MQLESSINIVLGKADGSEAIVTINKFDHIHSIMSALCARVQIADCIGLMDDFSMYFYGILYTPSLPHATKEDFVGTRLDVIKHIASTFHIEDYLEIGTFKNEVFDVASKLFPHAVGVDPVSGGTHRMTSDEFFANNTAMFDLIFVDGLHEANQVFKDVHHALDILKPG